MHNNEKCQGASRFLAFRLSPSPCAFSTDAFYDVLCLAYEEAFRDRNLRYLYVLKAVGVVADGACEVYVSVVMMVVGAVAYAVFLYAGAVVDKMQKSLLRKQSECAEKG